MPERPPYRPTIELGKPKTPDIEEDNAEELPDSAITPLPKVQMIVEGGNLGKRERAASIPAERRTGYSEPMAEASNTEVKGGDKAGAMEKIFALEKIKLEKLLATGEFLAEDLAADIREDLADAEVQFYATGPEDISERSSLERNIAVAKYKLSLLENKGDKK